MKKILPFLLLISHLSFSQLTWQWTKPLISNFNNNGATIQVECSTKDNAGNLYYGGYFNDSFDFDPSGNTAILTSTFTTGSTLGNCFICKYDVNGNFLWAKSFGNNLEQHVKGIAVDPSGNVNLTGSYYGTADFDPSAVGTYTMRAGMNSTLDPGCFVTRFDNTGNFIGAFSISSGYNSLHQAQSTGEAILIDSFGVLNIIGSFSGTLDFELSASLTHTLNSGGGKSMFIAKYFTSGNALSVIGFQGTGNSVPLDAKLNSNNDIYVTGWFNYTKSFYPNTSLVSYTSTPTSYENMFIAKYDQNLGLTWVKVLPGVGTTGRTVGVKLALDANEEPWIAGNMGGIVNFDSGFSDFTLNGGSFTNSFLTKYDNGGNFTQANVFTNNADKVFSQSIRFDNSNNMYFIGSTSSSVDIDLSAVGINTFTNGLFLIQNMNSSGFKCSNNAAGFSFFSNPITHVGLEVNSNDVYVSSFIVGNSFDFDLGPTTYTIGSSTFRGVFLSKYTNGVVTHKPDLKDKNATLHVFPNPTEGIFLIETQQEITITITNILGETILIQKLQQGKNVVNLNAQASGIYFIKNNNSTFKIIKQD